MTDDAGDAGTNRGTDRFDALARRAVDSVMLLVRRGVALAGGLLVITVALCGGGFLLGYAALSDGMQKVWIMLGGFFAVLAIGTAALTIVRLIAVRSRRTELIEEVRRLVAGDAQAERTVIETIDVNDSSQGEGVVVMSREFSSMRQSVGGRLAGYPALNTSLSAITSLPFLVFVTLVVSFVFACLSIVFMLALVV